MRHHLPTEYKMQKNGYPNHRHWMTNSNRMNPRHTTDQISSFPRQACRNSFLQRKHLEVYAMELC